MRQGKNRMVCSLLIDQIIRNHKHYDKVEPSWRKVLGIPVGLNLEDREEIILHLKQKVPYYTQWKFGLYLYEHYDSKLTPEDLNSEE